MGITLFKKSGTGFILGHVPALSRQEIIRTLAHENIDFKEVLATREVFLIETNSQLNVKELQERLGGTVKISKLQILSYKKDPNSNLQLTNNILELIVKRLKDLDIKDKKFQFGFSLYGNIDVKEFQKIGLTIKRWLKEKGVNSRLVVSKEKTLSSVIVKKERLIESGVDIVVIKDKDDYYLGYTVSIQGFEEYSQRDYGRPTRDDKSGMLPPKLAKIMINLSQTDSVGTILDPFCGSGTILQEALLLGYKNILGGDISQKAVAFAQNNLNWLKTKYGLDISGVKIYQLDAKDLSMMIEQSSVDAIVTEPYLGPTQSSKLKAQNLISELSNLYIKSFQEFYKVLKPGGRAVIILPIINGQLMDILEQIKSIGFIVEPLSDEPRGSIVYSREGQRVEREIFIFQKI